MLEVCSLLQKGCCRRRGPPARRERRLALNTLTETQLRKKIYKNMRRAVQPGIPFSSSRQDAAPHLDTRDCFVVRVPTRASDYAIKGRALGLG